MSFQPFNLFFRQAPVITSLAIPFDVANRPHPGNHSRNRWMAQDIAQGGFRHLIQTNTKIGNNLLDPIVYLLLSIAAKVLGTEVGGVKLSIRRDFPCEAPFVKGYPDNDPNLMLFTSRIEAILWSLLEDVVDDLNRVDFARFN